MKMDSDDISFSSWRSYTKIILDVFLTFSIATFCLGMYVIHVRNAFILTSILMGLLYFTVIVLCIKRLVEHLSPASLMLMIPIAPLAILLLVVSLLQVWQLFW